MSDTPIAPQPGIMDISVYHPGETDIPGANRVIKLSSNENPNGPSPNAVAAIKDAAEEVGRYPDGAHSALRNTLADLHGMDAAQILCGAGSDEVITFLCNAFAGPGDEVIYTEHGFAMYKISARAAGATPVEAPETDRHTDVDAILKAVTPHTKLVFVANPNNPTGTMIGEEPLARLAEGLKGKALLILDGAYAECVRVPGYDAGKALVDAHDHVVMTRSFSKIYGLGGLRIGWCYAPPAIIDVLNRVRGPFNVSSVALAAAEAAAKDVTYMEKCIIENEVWRDWLAKSLNAIGIPSDPSEANFILARFRDEATAKRADEALRAHGIIVRLVGGYKLPDCLRITIGTGPECQAVVAALSKFMSQNR